jgi:hypothetical protein
MDAKIKEAWSHGYASVKEYLISLEKEPPGGTIYASPDEEPTAGEKEERLQSVLTCDSEAEFGI